MNSKLSLKIKAEAQRLGFFSCGIAKAAPVEGRERDNYLQRVEEHKFADMDYMYRNVEKRLDPTLLVPGTKSIICVALNYAPSAKQNPDSYQFSAYALGQDYHDVMKQRLRELAASLGWKEIKVNEPEQNDNGMTRYRVFVDSAPVMERYWAQQAGIGWIGKSDMLVVPHAGTMFFLGEIFVNVELDYDKPMENHCGTCHRCIDACPTGAIAEGLFDASRCLSYQLIENRGELSDLAKEKMGNVIYGCDRCQVACPWNRFSTPCNDKAFEPKDELISMTKADWQNLDIEKYRELFKGSAVKRAKYEGLMRNIKAASKE